MGWTDVLAAKGAIAPEGIVDGHQDSPSLVAIAAEVVLSKLVIEDHGRKQRRPAHICGIWVGVGLEAC